MCSTTKKIATLKYETEYHFTASSSRSQSSRCTDNSHKSWSLCWNIKMQWQMTSGFIIVTHNFLFGTTHSYTAAPLTILTWRNICIEFYAISLPQSPNFYQTTYNKISTEHPWRGFAILGLTIFFSFILILRLIFLFYFYLKRLYFMFGRVLEWMIMFLFGFAGFLCVLLKCFCFRIFFCLNIFGAEPVIWLCFCWRCLTSLFGKI